MIAAGFEQLRPRQHPVRVVLLGAVSEADREQIEHPVHRFGRDAADEHRPHQVVDELRIHTARAFAHLDQRGFVAPDRGHVTAERGDVQAEPAPPHRLRAGHRIDPGEDLLRPIHLPGFERQAGRVRPVPEGRLAARRLPLRRAAPPPPG